MKNKVLSYHGLNSGKIELYSSWLLTLSKPWKHEYVFFFYLLFMIHQFLECIITIGEWITTHFVLSHHVRLKVVNSHTLSYFCGSWWQGTFAAQYTMVCKNFLNEKVWDCKIVKIEYTALKIFITIIFVHVPNHFE